MVDLTMDTIHDLMQSTSNIRNISVIAHVDHGKSTLTDTLLIKAKIVSVESGGKRSMDTRQDEQERGITIKSTAISLHFELEDKKLALWCPEYKSNQCDNKVSDGKTSFLINLIDSPGHVDFSSEVTAALRVTDGALVVVDCVDGICVQTETVLRQAIAERIKPTLCLNKLDRALLELKEPKVELYTKLRKRIEDFNAKLEIIGLAYQNPEFSVKSLCPGDLEVSFCSGLQQWGFTLATFARFYLKRFNLQDKPNAEFVFAKGLWNDQRYFSSSDPFDKEGKFMTTGDPERKVFIVFVLNPIYHVRDLCYEGKVKELKEYLNKFEVKLPEDLTGEGKNLFKVVMRTWLSAADVLLEQIVLKIPSPKASQIYRASLLYEGPTDCCFTAIKECNATKCNSNNEEPPVMMYVSKMVPYADNRFIALGRVFSGTIAAGMKVRIQGPDYVPGSKNDLYTKTIQRTVVLMGSKSKDVVNCPAGNIIGLIGIDNELKKTGTITTYEGAYNIKSMKFSVSPVVKYSVRPKNASDLPKLKEGLLKLSKSDPLCVINFSDNGELTIAGAGELHLEICINDLKNDYAGVEIVVDEPVVTYIEGISGSTTDAKMSKSANKHNRIYMTCEPLEEEIVENIINGKLVHKDPKERAALWKEHIDCSEDYVKKILFYGPEDKGPNIIVDETKGIAYLNEIKEYMREGFREVTSRGPLVGEMLRGVRFNLTDLALHADAIHRTGNQITAPVTSVCKGLIMNSIPILYEPIFFAEINVSNQHMNGVCNVISRRRGTIEEYRDENGIRTTITGYLPVRESFGFNAEMMGETKGQASSVLSFSHYSVLPGRFDCPGSITAETVKKIRTKRGMGEYKPAENYFDRL
ncbi:translation elongation factor 2 [Conglomerata obtusa]